MTSSRGGLQLWKCLYLARNVTKGNNVLSQSTLMDLPTISPVPPLTRETRETTANKAALPLIARVLVTAVQLCWRPVCPLAPETHTLTVSIESYRLSAFQTCLIGRMVVMSDTKELHLKCSFYTDNRAAELNVSLGHVLVMWVEPSFTVMPLVVATAWPHIDCIGNWSWMVMSWVCKSGWDGLLTDNCNTLTNLYVSTQTKNAHIRAHTLLLFIGILGPPTFLLRRLIVAGCVALHMRGKHNSYYLYWTLSLSDLRRHAFIHIQTYFEYPQRMVWIRQ